MKVIKEQTNKQQLVLDKNNANIFGFRFGIELKNKRGKQFVFEAETAEEQQKINDYKLFKGKSEQHAIESIISEQFAKKIEKIREEFNLKNKSPYGRSYYDTDKKDWNYTPEGSLRLADHWNFSSGGRVHCPLKETEKKVNQWILAIFLNGKYEILEYI